MKKTTTKFIIFLALLIVFLSCGPGRKVQNNNNGVYSYSMQILFDKSFSLYQFDSLCVADTLPRGLEKWRKADFYDFETEQKLLEYYYIKRLGNNETVYRLLKEDEKTYNVLKRVVYVTKKED